MIVTIIIHVVLGLFVFAPILSFSLEEAISDYLENKKSDFLKSVAWLLIVLLAGPAIITTLFLYYHVKVPYDLDTWLNIYLALFLLFALFGVGGHHYLFSSKKGGHHA